MSWTLYGTTYSGGAHGDGTVFAIDPDTDTETVLYTFCSQQSCADGSGPGAGPIDVKGTLYGTNVFGGSESSGTVFALTTNRVSRTDH
ncbi:MAG TPA: choice-of-anchor tandem repeat GloVer-containing protein [Rhizomicrobium sp.]|nr:choice-of-anchor tandem repeat GloVer-containing protein [Rhizomicrobium sp.]